MITSIKHNKRERVSAFKKMKDFKEGKNIEVYFDKKVSKYQLKKIRDKIQQENKYRLKKNIIIFTIAMLILIYAIGFVKF